jgi:hypothetical protein
MVRLVDNLEAVGDAIRADEGRDPLYVGTTARQRPNATRFSEMRERLETSDDPHCLVFGTGWGLAGELLEQLDFVLEPVAGPSDYNHLSVRAAVAIILDRLRGNRKTP